MKSMILSALVILPSFAFAQAQLRCEVTKQTLRNAPITQCVEWHAENCTREEVSGYELRPFGSKSLDVTFDSDSNGPDFYGNKKAFNKEVVVEVWVSPSYTTAKLTSLVDGNETRFQTTTAEHSRSTFFTLDLPTKARNKEGSVSGFSLTCRQVR